MIQVKTGAVKAKSKKKPIIPLAILAERSCLIRSQAIRKGERPTTRTFPAITGVLMRKFSLYSQVYGSQKVGLRLPASTSKGQQARNESVTSESNSA